MERKKKLLWAAAFAGVFLLALSVRVYRLGELPYGWHIDEAGMAYDIHSLLYYGTDRYYKFNPVYFINFGGGQNALYGYICGLFMKAFGLSLAVVRIPAVLSGMVTWLFGTLILRKCFERKFALLGSFLIAVLPCFIMQSRIALESLLFLSVSTAALYFLLLAAEKERLRLYILTGAALGLCLYTYAISYLVVPLFLALALGYLLYLGKLSWGRVLSLGIPLAILAAPLICMIVINTFELPEIATTCITIPRLPEYRGSEIDLRNILHNLPELMESYFFRDWMEYNAVDHYFTMYAISIPFVLLGFQKAVVHIRGTVREKRFAPETLLLFWLLSQTAVGLLVMDVNVNKVNGAFFSLLFFAVYGIRHVWKLIGRQRAKRLFLGAVTCVYACFFAAFAGYYFGAYTEDTFPLSDFADCYDDILDAYADVIQDRKVYVNARYIYYALGEELAPQEFQLIEQGTESRGNVYFALPEEVDGNGFYILSGRESMLEQLQTEGFEIRNEGFYTVCYRR